MVVDFDGELIQMPSTDKKESTLYVRFENKRYCLVTEDDFKKSLVKENKVETNKDNVSDDK